MSFTRRGFIWTAVNGIFVPKLTGPWFKQKFLEKPEFGFYGPPADPKPPIDPYECIALGHDSHFVRLETDEFVPAGALCFMNERGKVTQQGKLGDMNFLGICAAPGLDDPVRGGPSQQFAIVQTSGIFRSRNNPKNHLDLSRSGYFHLWNGE